MQVAIAGSRALRSVPGSRVRDRRLVVQGAEALRGSPWTEKEPQLTPTASRGTGHLATSCSAVGLSLAFGGQSSRQF